MTSFDLSMGFPSVDRFEGSLIKPVDVFINPLE